MPITISVILFIAHPIMVMRDVLVVCARQVKREAHLLPIPLPWAILLLSTISRMKWVTSSAAITPSRILMKAPLHSASPEAVPLSWDTQVLPVLTPIYNRTATIISMRAALNRSPTILNQEQVAARAQW